MQTVTPSAGSTSLPLPLLMLVFFMSGSAALIYQVCWQRLLFAAFGVDVESVTLIVSVFMCGLGLGALVGGQLADRYPTRIPELFAGAELLIGAFGFASPLLIGWIAQQFMLASVLVIGMANFLLLLLPTCLMGATLPMLTCHLYQRFHNVGGAIGRLYFINTLGAALGSLVTGLLVFNWLELNESIRLAACLNVTVSLLTFAGLKLVGRTQEQPAC